ncbi:hypothetical protein HMPREF3226_02189 [Prevotella corporis]|uniref:Uncharacterized protein n=1 Tax=Prevotella corporis TaxID=28128 RepID=A0A133PXI9_9BACT|nr:hypothetical protein HMPREF3226_02189 [Prevotella corporis]
MRFLCLNRILYDAILQEEASMVHKIRLMRYVSTSKDVHKE